MNNIDPMLTLLFIAGIVIGLSFWAAQSKPDFSFDLFDLLMEGGKVSKIAVSYMLVLLVSTYVIIDQQINGQLTEGMFGLWLGAWVTPLVARVVFNKQEPTNVSITETRTVETKVPDDA